MVALWAPGSAAFASKRVPALVLSIAGLRFGLMGVYQLSSDHAWEVRPAWSASGSRRSPPTLPTRPEYEDVFKRACPARPARRRPGGDQGAYAEQIARGSTRDRVRRAALEELVLAAEDRETESSANTFMIVSASNSPTESTVRLSGLLRRSIGTVSVTTIPAMSEPWNSSSARCRRGRGREDPRVFRALLLQHLDVLQQRAAGHDHVVADDRDLVLTRPAICR